MSTHRKLGGLFAALAVGLILSLSLFVTVGCGGESASGDGESNVFKIGEAADLSGLYAVGDTMIRDGAQFAVDEINAAGGVNGMQLELIVKDTKNDKALALQITQELIDAGVQYLICTTGDHVVSEALICEQNSIPCDPANGTNPSATEDGGEWLFQYIMADNVQGAAMANYCYTDLGYRTAYVLKSPDSAYSNNMPLYFKDVFERLGGTVVEVADYKVEAGDFSAQVTKIQNASPRPDVIYTPMWLPDTGVFLKQLRAAGVDIPVASCESSDTNEMKAIGAAVLDGLLVPTHAFPSPGSPLAELYAKYEAKTGAPPESVFFAVGYDTIYIVKAALEKSGGEGGEALRDALLQLSGVKLSTTDNFVMDPETRRAKRQVALLKMEGDEFVFVKDLPYPDYVPNPY